MNNIFGSLTGVGGTKLHAGDTTCLINLDVAKELTTTDVKRYPSMTVQCMGVEREVAELQDPLEDSLGTRCHVDTLRARLEGSREFFIGKGKRCNIIKSSSC